MSTGPSLSVTASSSSATAYPVGASEARFQAVWESSADAMALSDQSGIVLAANPAYFELYGYQPHQVVGHSFAIIFPESERATALTEYQRFFAEGQNRSSVEAVVQRSDGTTRAVEVRYAFIEEEGRRTAMLSVIRDITDRTRLREAEVELAQQKDDVLLAVSHDLKNPMTSIRGFAQLLQRRLKKSGGVDVPALLDGLGQIERTATRMNRLIEDLEDSTTMGMGHDLDLRRVPMDLIATTREAIEQRQEQAGDRHEIGLETSEPEIIGVWDPSRIYRVIDNLLSNAVKYSPSGGRITVRLEREDGCAILEVADSGVGIAEADLPHVFDRFFRAERVRDKVPGSGIGLFGICRIVQRHGGSIDVDSKEGEGTTFTVRLPLST